MIDINGVLLRWFIYNIYIYIYIYIYLFNKNTSGGAATRENL